MFKNKGRLSGTRTDIKGNKDNKRSLQRENESADTLVEYGYNVEQNPLTKTDDNIRKGKQPDYRVNGEIFDNYAPNNKADVEQIRNEISRKVKRGQTYRVRYSQEEYGQILTNISSHLLDNSNCCQVSFIFLSTLGSNKEWLYILLIKFV